MVLVGPHKRDLAIETADPHAHVLWHRLCSNSGHLQGGLVESTSRVDFWKGSKHQEMVLVVPHGRELAIQIANPCHALWQRLWVHLGHG